MLSYFFNILLYGPEEGGVHAEVGHQLGSPVPFLRREYASNKKLRPVLLSCIRESGLDESAEKTRSELVVRVATKVLT